MGRPGGVVCRVGRRLSQSYVDMPITTNIPTPQTGKTTMTTILSGLVMLEIVGIRHRRSSVDSLRFLVPLLPYNPSNLDLRTSPPARLQGSKDNVKF